MKSISEGADKFLGAISTRLGNISPKLKAKMRELEFNVGTKANANAKKVTPLLKKANKMSKSDRIAFDYARKNSDTNKITELVDKYEMHDEYTAYREVLEDLRKDGLDVGLEIGRIDEYAPRVLKNVKGFMKAIGASPDLPLYTKALEQRADELGLSVEEMTPEMRADIISNMIAYGPKGLGGVRSTKQRTVEKIPPELDKYYLDSDAALLHHIYSMQEAIEARRFFGKTPQRIKDIKSNLNRTEKALREISDKGRITSGQGQRKELKRLKNLLADRKLQQKAKALESKIVEYEKNVKDLQIAYEKTQKELLTAREGGDEATISNASDKNKLAQRKVSSAKSKLTSSKKRLAEHKELYGIEDKAPEQYNKEISELKKKIGFSKLRLSIKNYEDNIVKYKADLERYKTQRDFTENIGAFIDEQINKGEISLEQQKAVHDILDARFHGGMMGGIAQLYKNMSYIDTMGSPISALTQIGDLAFSLYDAGFYQTLKQGSKSGLGQALKVVGLKKLAPKMKFTREDMGFERIAQEFMDAGKMGKAVEKVFKMVGLEQMDAIGKETLMNAAYEKYRERAKKAPKELYKELDPMFGDETMEVINDLKEDNINDNTRLLIHSKLLDFQPMAKSEMPEMYLRMGNGRLFYMLKSFTLKQFDVFRRETFQKLRTGTAKERVKALKNFARLSMFFVTANAGADELKDFMLGRKTDFSDRVVDNMLRLLGISKFVTWKARTEGVGSAIFKQVAPPFKFIDSLTKDIVGAGDGKGLEILSSAPVLGKLLYWRYGRGTSKRKDLWDRRLSKRKAKLKQVWEKYEQAPNKTKFKNEHKKELTEYRSLKQLQGKLNTMKQRINKLKSETQTKARKRQIEKLEKQRQELIKDFLEKG
jgi:hypothetical protein